MANAEYTGSNAQQSSRESPIELNVHHVGDGPIHVICYLKAGLPLRRETSGARRTARPHPRSPAPAVQHRCLAQAQASLSASTADTVLLHGASIGVESRCQTSGSGRAVGVS